MVESWQYGAQTMTNRLQLFHFFKFGSGTSVEVAFKGQKKVWCKALSVLLHKLSLPRESQRPSAMVCCVTVGLGISRQQVVIYTWVPMAGSHMRRVTVSKSSRCSGHTKLFSQLLRNRPKRIYWLTERVCKNIFVNIWRKEIDREKDNE